MKTILLIILCPLLLAGCDNTQPPTTTLYLAMRRGDVEQIERHIATGTDMNQLDSDGYAPLHIAVRDGRIAITRLLLKHGVNMEVKDRNGHTPMYHAIMHGHIRIARLLQKQGAVIKPTTWLLDAASRGIDDRDSIAYLIEQGADIETVNAQGDTPLLIAIREGNHKLAKHLVNLGARVTVTDAQGKTALEIAKSLGLSDIALLLLRNGAT